MQKKFEHCECINPFSSNTVTPCVIMLQGIFHKHVRIHHSSSPTPYNNPQAKTAANTPLPATGPNALAAPALLVGVAAPVGDVAAFPCRLPIATPLTPVPFLHWSSARSWAVALNFTSAHYGIISKVFTYGERTLKTYVVQSASALAKLYDLNSGIETVKALISNTAVTRKLESFVEVRASGLL
jgi:hypothetical protein